MLFRSDESKEKNKKEINNIKSKNNSKIILREIKTLKYNKKTKIFFNLNYRNVYDCINELYLPLMQNIESISSFKSNTENTLSCLEFFCTHNSIFELLNSNEEKNGGGVLLEIMAELKIFEIKNSNQEEKANSDESKNFKEKWKYQYHIFGINKIKFNSDNKYLLSGGNDCQVNIVDINSQNLLRNFRVESIVTSLDINYSNNILAVGTYDYLMYLFDIRTRNCICKMICHSEPITDVKFYKCNFLNG